MLDFSNTYYPKGLYVIKYNGKEFVVKSTDEYLEQLCKENKIEEYKLLTVYKMEGR